MTITYIDAKELTRWFERAKGGDVIAYYTGTSLPYDCRELPAVENLREAVHETAFERGPDGRLLDKNTLHLVQRRVGPKPEGNKSGIFEYIAVKRGDRS
jgi:hypothetical protein